MARALATMALLTTLAATPSRAQAEDVPDDAVCDTYRITGYSVTDYPGWTADGSTTTEAARARGEAIAAGSVNIPLGAFVDIAGLGVYRVRDRGNLGPRHLDLLVGSRDEAYAVTGYRAACWWRE